MPTLTRLILVLALITAAIYAVMLALVYWVKPQSHQITVRIPQHQLQQLQPAAPAKEPTQPNTENPGEAVGEPEGEQNAN